jgi:hypothetical protein
MLTADSLLDNLNGRMTAQKLAESLGHPMRSLLSPR